MTTYKMAGNTLVGQTRREIQERYVVIERQADGSLQVLAYASGPYEPLKSNDFQNTKHAQSWAIAVWLGGPVDWQYASDGDSDKWTSDTIVTANGGCRLTAEELEFVRKHWRKK